MVEVQQKWCYKVSYQRNEQYDVISSEPLYGNEWPLPSWTDVIFYWSPLRNSLFSFSPAVRSERSISHSCELHPCVQYQAQGHSSRTHARWHVRVSSIGLRTPADPLRLIQNEWHWFIPHKVFWFFFFFYNLNHCYMDWNTGVTCALWKLENYLANRFIDTDDFLMLTKVFYTYPSIFYTCFFLHLGWWVFAGADHRCNWEKAGLHTGQVGSLSQLQKIIQIINYKGSLESNASPFGPLDSPAMLSDNMYFPSTGGHSTCRKVYCLLLTFTFSILSKNHLIFVLCLYVTQILKCSKRVWIVWIT